MNPNEAPNPINPIIAAMPGIPGTVLIAMEYYHSSSDDEEVEGVADLPEVLNPPAAEEPPEPINPIIAAMPGIPGIVLIAMAYYHASSDDEEVEGMADLPEVLNPPAAEELLEPVNPIIAAMPGIPGIVLIAMEYYHTSSDDEEVEGVADLPEILNPPAPAAAAAAEEEPPEVELPAVAEDREEDTVDGGVSYEKPPSPTEEEKMKENEKDIKEVAVTKLQPLGLHDQFKEKPSGSNSAPSGSPEDYLLAVSLLMESVRRTEVKQKLQKAQSEAESFIETAQALVSKVQLLRQNLPLNHLDAQKQILALVSEFEAHKIQYDHFRYDNEENDQSFQLMAQKYASLAREIDKLQADDLERTGAPSASAEDYGGKSNQAGGAESTI